MTSKTGVNPKDTCCRLLMQLPPNLQDKIMGPAFRSLVERLFDAVCTWRFSIRLSVALLLSLPQLQCQHVALH